MGLTKKKITVRGKKKTYQRTVMVRSDKAPVHAHRAMQSLVTPGNYEPSMAQRALAHVTGIFQRKQQAGVLNSMHPWQDHHLGPDTGSMLGVRSQQNDRYMPGPGSDHSFFAHRVGSARGSEQARYETGWYGGRYKADGPGTEAHAKARAYGGRMAGVTAASAPIIPERRYANARVSDLAKAFGGAVVSSVRQNSRKWVR